MRHVVSASFDHWFVKENIRYIKLANPLYYNSSQPAFKALLKPHLLRFLRFPVTKYPVFSNFHTACNKEKVLYELRNPNVYKHAVAQPHLYSNLQVAVLRNADKVSATCMKSPTRQRWKELFTFQGCWTPCVVNCSTPYSVTILMPKSIEVAWEQWNGRCFRYQLEFK